MHNKSFMVAAMVACGVALGNAWAVDLPTPANQPAPALDEDAAKPDPSAKPEAMPMVQNGKIAYIGVGSTAVPEILATHLGLKKGQGVVVRALDPEGPAASAGIAENDILLRVNDKAVGSQLELRDAILVAKPGDEVKLDLIHQGKPIHKTVKLGSRPAAMAVPQGNHGNMVPFGGAPDEQARRLRQAIEQELEAMQGAEDIDKQLKELEKRMRFMFQGLGAAPGDDDEDADDVQVSSMATIRMFDEEGSVEIEMKNGSKHVRVCDDDGKVQWEGPWDTDQDKAAAPEGIRDRIESMNIDMMEHHIGPGKFRMKIGPGLPNGAPAPAKPKVKEHKVEPDNQPKVLEKKVAPGKIELKIVPPDPDDAKPEEGKKEEKNEN